MGRAVAIVVAGGSGRRMEGRVAKQYLPLGGVPILSRTLRAVSLAGTIDEIFLVVPAGDEIYCEDTILSAVRVGKPVHIVPGGGERQASVRNGLLAAKADFSVVAIHDGVRPFVNPKQIDESIHTAEALGACMLAVPTHDTLKRVDETGVVRSTLSREGIWLAQTPQTFRFDTILKAHQTAEKEGFPGTDDAALAERIGCPVHVIPGSRFNIKITTPEDLALAEAILSCSIFRSDP